MKSTTELYGLYTYFDDKRYIIVPPNNKKKNNVSIQNEKNFKFLRHASGKIVETTEDYNTEFFNDDSSFIPHEKNNGFIFQCSNNGMENFYICKIGSANFIVHYDIEEYVFYIQKSNNTISQQIKNILMLNGNEYIIKYSIDDSTSIFLKNTINNKFLYHSSGLIEERDIDKNYTELNNYKFKIQNNKTFFYIYFTDEFEKVFYVKEANNSLESDFDLKKCMLSLDRLQDSSELCLKISNKQKLLEADVQDLKAKMDKNIEYLKQKMESFII